MTKPLDWEAQLRAAMEHARQTTSMKKPDSTSRYVPWAEQRQAQLEEARRKFKRGVRVRVKGTNLTGVVIAHPPTAADAGGNYGMFGVRLDGIESPSSPEDTDESVRFIAPEGLELVEPSD